MMNIKNYLDLTKKGNFLLFCPLRFRWSFDNQFNRVVVVRTFTAANVNEKDVCLQLMKKIKEFTQFLLKNELAQ